MIVRTTHNAAKLTVRSRAMAIALTPAVLKSEEQSAKAMVKRARALSQGWLSEDDLKRLGHPYKRGGNAPIDPAIINRHSGNFEGRWQSRVTFQGDGTQLTLFNTAGYAKYFRGTSKMIPRPILEAVIRLEQGARLLRLESARKEVFTKK